MRILVAAATSFELAPFREHLRQVWEQKSEQVYIRGSLEIYICITGIGMMLTTYHLMEGIVAFSPHFCLQMGVAGTFNPRLKLGDVVIVREELMGDLGVEEKNHFKDIFTIQLMDASEKPFVHKKLINSFLDFPMKLNLPFVTAITVNTVSGTAGTIKSRLKDYDCDLESMEGAAFHYVCLAKGIPFLQVRGISNHVEPRNRDNWKMKEAIGNLNKWVIDNLPH